MKSFFDFLIVFPNAVVLKEAFFRDGFQNSSHAAQ